MKRILLSLVVLCILMMAASVAAENSVTVYESDFTKNEDGWYGRGAVISRTDEHALYTEDRSSDWHSPGRDFKLVEGTIYEVRVEVRQNTMDEASFIVSVAHSNDGIESYENLVRGSASRGEWTSLQGQYTAADFERFVLYIETTGAGTMPFEIRNFQLSAPYGVKEMKPEEPVMVIPEVGEIPKLREIYADAFDFGTAAPQSAFYSKRLTKLMLEQFNLFTPENELKPDAVIDIRESQKLVENTSDEKQVAIQLSSAKPILDFAKKNNLHVHGHVLVWHSQTPEAFFHEGYNSKRPLLDRETMLARMENYIAKVLTAAEEEYPGIIVSWDVLNEAIDDSTGWLRDSNWRKIIGDDYPQKAFEYARKYAREGLKLYYNDYNTAIPNKRKGIERLLKSLIDEGNIDGYGFQMHHSIGFPSMEDITASVESIANLDLSLRVSELDIGAGSNSETAFMKQAEKYAAIMKLLLRFSDRVDAVQVWGLNDSMSWRSSDYPLLFDAKCNPKPAFWAVADPASFE